MPKTYKLSFYFYLFFTLEDLRDKQYRDKYWNIYLGNPKTYKLLQYEPKRIQAIDKKLKTLAPIQKCDNFKTFDSSLTHNSEKIKSRYDNQATFLLRDISKLDPSVRDNVFFNNTSLTNCIRERSPRAPLNSIWMNNTNNNQLLVANSVSPVKDEAKIERNNYFYQQSSASSSPNNSNQVPNSFLLKSDENEQSDDLKNFNPARRFTIEKIKDVV